MAASQVVCQHSVLCPCTASCILNLIPRTFDRARSSLSLVVWLNPCALNIEVDVFLRDKPSGSVASNYINLEIFTIILLILRRYPTPRSPPRPAPHATCSLTEPSPSTSSTGTLTSSIGACPGSPHTNFIGAALTLFDRHRAVFISSHFRRSAPHGAPNPAASARAHLGLGLFVPRF